MKRVWWAVVGGVLAAVAHAQTPLPRIPTAQLLAGHFAFVPDPYSAPPRESEILLLRERSGVLRAWFIPLRQGLRRLPEDLGWAPGPACPQLVADFDAGEVRCLNPDMSEALRARYRWRLDGRRLTDFVPDLIAIPGAELEGAFVLHLPRRP